MHYKIKANSCVIIYIFSIAISPSTVWMFIVVQIWQISDNLLWNLLVQNSFWLVLSCPVTFPRMNTCVSGRKQHRIPRSRILPKKLVVRSVSRPLWSQRCVTEDSSSPVDPILSDLNPLHTQICLKSPIIFFSHLHVILFRSWHLCMFPVVSGAW